MTKTQRDSMIAVVMVLLFGAAATRAAKFGKNPASPSAAASAQAPGAPSKVETQLLEDAQFIGSVRSTNQTLQEQSGRWDQEWERDPFQYEVVASAGGGVENLTLHGVFWEAESPRAIINDKTLHLGEAIDGYKIIEIHPSSVLMWTGEKNLELRVFQSPFQQAPSSDEGVPAKAANPEPAQPVKEEPPAKRSFLPDMPMFQGINKSLATAETFVTDIKGAEEMQKLMEAASSGSAPPSQS